MKIQKKWIVVLVSIGILSGFFWDNGLSEEDSTSGVKTSVATSTRHLAGCMVILDSSQGGWCDMRVKGEKPGISNVWPSPMDSHIRQITGPFSILTTWNSAAYDSDDKILYFMGGGHADYGGNEVYSFSLASGRWERLTDPSPLAFFTGSERSSYYRIPDTRLVPASTHTYDGLIFNRLTRTIMLLSLGAANGAKVKPTSNMLASEAYLDNGGGAAQYEFNPSPSEIRNGISPLGWRKIGKLGWTYPRSVQLPSGEWLLGSSTQLFHTSFSESGSLQENGRFSNQADYGDGNAVYDELRKLVWSIHRNSLLAFDLTGKLVKKISDLPNVGKSIAFDTRGNIVSWDGGTKVYTLNPDAPDARWRVFDSENNGPVDGAVGRVYGKWVHIGNDYFVGVSSSKHGVWLYHAPGEKSRSHEISNVSLQAILDDAIPGSTVTLPPGIYGTGLIVNKPITVNMKGVELWGVAGGKAVLVIETKGPVTINNFHVDGRKAIAKSGNLAGIRASGQNFNVTLNNLHIVHTAMGVLTDNRGGHLILDNAYISDIGTPDTYDALSHVLYAGEIDYLEVNNSTLQNSRRLGHILKSRARETLVLHSQLLGLNENHSRVIDFPCGGRLVVENSVLQSSSRTDNSDMISVGVEAETHCRRGGVAGDVVMRNNKLIFDRGALETKEEHKQNPNRIFTWRGELKGLVFEDNVIVNPVSAPVFYYSSDGTRLPGLDESNIVYKNRAAAGFNIEANTPP